MSQVDFRGALQWCDVKPISRLFDQRQENFGFKGRGETCVTRQHNARNSARTVYCGIVSTLRSEAIIIPMIDTGIARKHLNYF